MKMKMKMKKMKMKMKMKMKKMTNKMIQQESEEDEEEEQQQQQEEDWGRGGGKEKKKGRGGGEEQEEADRKCKNTHSPTERHSLVKMFPVHRYLQGTLHFTGLPTTNLFRYTSLKCMLKPSLTQL